MPIHFHCCQCQAAIATPDGTQGGNVRCPHCGAVQRIPEPVAGAPALNSPATGPLLIPNRVEDMTDQDDVADAIPPRPADSLCTVKQHADGVTITVPARGFIAGTNGLGLWSACWCGVVGAGTIYFGLIMLVGTPVRGSASNWVLLPFAAPFWIPAVLMMWLSLRMGLTNVVVDVTGISTGPGTPGATLLITEQFPWRIRQRRRPCARLKSINVGPNRLALTQRYGPPTMEVQIKVTHGRKIRLFTGRKVDELDWLAAILRQATGASDGGMRVWAWFRDGRTGERIKSDVPPELNW